MPNPNAKTALSKKLIDVNLVRDSRSKKRSRYELLERACSVLQFDRLEPGGEENLWVLPLATGGNPYLLQQRAGLGQFSPDGRWIAYVSEVSGRKEVFVTAFPTTGAKWQISKDGGTKPRWSPEGRKLIYLAADLRLTEVDVEIGGTTFESGAPRRLFDTAFAFEDERVPFAVGRGGTDFLIAEAAKGPESSPVTMVLNWPSLLPRRK